MKKLFDRAVRRLLKTNIAAGLLALAGISGKTGGLAVKQPLVSTGFKTPDPYKNQPPAKTRKLRWNKPTIPLLAKGRSRNNQRQRRKLNRQQNPQGFKYRHC